MLWRLTRPACTYRPVCAALCQSLAVFIQVSEKERAAAEQEVQLLQDLDHAFILGYVDAFEYKQHLCIITEYCEAGDLYSYLKVVGCDSAKAGGRHGLKTGDHILGPHLSGP